MFVAKSVDLMLIKIFHKCKDILSTLARVKEILAKFTLLKTYHTQIYVKKTILPYCGINCC